MSKPLNEPELGAFDFWPDPPTSEPRDPMDLRSLEEVAPYVEAQIHGGLESSAIAEVIFDKAPPPALTAQLDALHIPWHVR